MALFLPFAELAEQLAATPAKLKKRAAIAESLRALHAAAPDSADAGLFALYLAGEPFAESDPRKLNAGGALLSKALLAVSGAGDAALTAAYRRHGDLGSAAFDLLSENRLSRARSGLARAQGAAQGEESAFASSPLTLADAAAAFAAMASARTTAARARTVEDLLRRASPLEAKYLLKLMLGDMRIGVKQSLVEEAIAVAAGAQVTQVRNAVMLEADLSCAVRRAFAGTLGEARMRLFHPLGFMLASPVATPEEAVERFTAGSKPETGHDSAGEGNSPRHIEAFLEDKYDGIRAQMHFADPEQPGRVVLYSRNCEDITESFPELAEAFAGAPLDPAAQLGHSFILDGEILAWNFGSAADPPAADAHALPFAVFGQRLGRKRVSNDLRARIPVLFMAFDLLCANGELTLHLPLRERRNRLEAIVERLASHTVSPLERDEQAHAAQASLFQAEMDVRQRVTSFPRLLLSPSRTVEDAADIDRAYAAARARSNEGVMIKAVDSIYQPGRRGLAWVKLKRELAALDVVITGAEYGHGKRAGSLSDYTFAVRGPAFEDRGELLNVGKAYSGLTDPEIAELTEFLKAHTLEDQGHFRTVEPLIVLEVAFNNIMRSDRHASGFALRFPRILRLRPDKPLAEIDTLARVEEIYQSQVDKPAEA